MLRQRRDRVTNAQEYPGAVSAQNHEGNLSSSLSSLGHFPVTPVLSVKLNSRVHPGDYVTLLCWSRDPVDTFILYKEGKVHQPQRRKAMFQDSQYQAEFTLSAVTSAVSGSYRCYGSQNSSLYLLSYASAPVELIVSGEVTLNCRTDTQSKH